MNYTECQKYMKNFFEKYYEKLSEDDISLKLPLDNEEKEMWADDINPNEEWKKWKLVPVTMADDKIEELEENIETKLPLYLKAFLTTYHHYFECPIGRNPINEPFQAIEQAYNPILVNCGYLPFTWDDDGYFIICIKLDAMPNEDDCGIYQIDHEILFDFDEDDEEIPKKEIDENMEFVSKNLITYLEAILNK